MCDLGGAVTDGDEPVRRERVEHPARPLVPLEVELVERHSPPGKQVTLARGEP